jgi:hypothetical protein
LEEGCKLVDAGFEYVTEIESGKIFRKDPEKVLKSESLTVMIEESKRERLKSIKNLPKGIQGLIDIIDRPMDKPELDPLQ